MRKAFLSALALFALSCGDVSSESTKTRAQAVDCVSQSNVRITNINQAATFAREACDEIDGDVWISGSEAIEFTSTVHTIRGTLYIVDFSGLELNLFDRLRSVDAIYVKGAGPADLDLRSLEEASSIRMTDCGVATVDLPSLTMLGDLTIQNCNELQTMSTGGLQTARNVRLHDLPALESVTTQLEGVNGDLAIERTRLQSLDDFSSLRMVEGTLSIGMNFYLRDVSGLALNSVGDTLGIAQSPLLTSYDGNPELDTHAGLLALVDMVGLIDIPGVLSMSSIGELELSRLPLLTIGDGFSMDLQSLSRLRLDTLSPAWTLADLKLPELDHVTIANVETFDTLEGLRLTPNASVYVIGNDVLTDVSTIETPAILDIVWFHGNDIPRLGWPNVTTITDLRMISDLDVVAVGLPSLTRIENDLEIRSLRNLNNDVELGQLGVVGDDFTLQSSGITNPSFPNLTIVDDDVLIRGNDNLVSLDGIDLNRVGDSANISFNPTLAPCQVDAFLARISDGPARVYRMDNTGMGPCN